MMQVSAFWQLMTFLVLDGYNKKLVLISADLIYVKPATPYRVGHVIGFAQNYVTPTLGNRVNVCLYL